MDAYEGLTSFDPLTHPATHVEADAGIDVVVHRHPTRTELHCRHADHSSVETRHVSIVGRDEVSDDRCRRKKVEVFGHARVATLSLDENREPGQGRTVVEQTGFMLYFSMAFAPPPGTLNSAGIS